MYYLHTILVIALQYLAINGNVDVFHRSKRLKDPFIVFSGQYGLQQCTKECLLRTNCNALGFDRQALRCELGSTTDVEEADVSTSLTISRIDLPQIDLKQCTNHICGVGEKCIVSTATRQAVCIITDCGSLVVANGEPLSTSALVGESVPVKCNSDFTQIGKPEITCKANGQWSLAGFECEENSSSSED